MTDLSSSAKAVFDAIRINWETYPEKDQRYCIACVLRALVDEVLPAKWASSYSCITEELRDEILEIAAELEGFDG